MAAKKKPAAKINVGAWGGANAPTTTGTTTAPASSTGTIKLPPGIDDIAQAGVHRLLGDIGGEILPGQTGPKSHGIEQRPAKHPERDREPTAQAYLALFEHVLGDSQMTKADLKTLTLLDNKDLARTLEPHGTNPIAWGQSTEKRDAVKRQLIHQITAEIPGLDEKQLEKVEPKHVLGMPISKNLSTLFGQDGYNIPEGTPIGAAIDHVDPVKLFKDKQVLGAVQGQLTVSQAYNNLMGSYDHANASQKKILTQQLLNARLLTTLDPSHAEIQSAYASLIRQSVTSKVSVNDILVNNPTSSPQAAEIASAESKLGVVLNQQQYNTLVKQASAAASTSTTGSGWSTAQISQAVAQFFTFQGSDKLTGDAALLYQGIKKIADEYQIPLSDQTAGQWLTNAIKGVDYGDPTVDPLSLTQGTSATQASFLQHAKNQAVSMFPQFADQINKGMTTKTLLEPYAEVAASVLGYGSVSGTGNSVSAAATGDAISSLGINWNQPKWATALQGGRDPATKQSVPMTLDQWRAHLITDPQYGWQHTDDAKNAATSVADHLLSVFGQPAAQGQ